MVIWSGGIDELLVPSQMPMPPPAATTTTIGIVMRLRLNHRRGPPVTSLSTIGTSSVTSSRRNGASAGREIAMREVKTADLAMRSSGAVSTL